MLRHNNAELLSVTPVATLRERVFQVFGSQILDDLVDLGDRDRDLNMPPREAPPRSRASRGDSGCADSSAARKCRSSTATRSTCSSTAA